MSESSSVRKPVEAYPVSSEAGFEGDARSQIEQSLERYCHFFETISRDRLVDLEALVTEDVFFADPFNEVTGREPMTLIFDEMYDRIAAPCFVFKSRAIDWDAGPVALLQWEMHTGPEGSNALTIVGTSELHFAEDGRVSYHRDYWDPARQLYERVPVLGSLMRFVRRRLELKTS